MARTAYTPPFDVTPSAIARLMEIMRLVGRYEGLLSPPPQPKLRRQNRIRTVVGSLAIEGNTLSTEQATAIMDNKRVIGPKREVLEVRNAISTYSRASNYDPGRSRDLLLAHRSMMDGLIEDAGRYRSKAVGVFQGSHVAHVAPAAKRVGPLVEQLFEFVRRATSTHPLVNAAVTHYKLEFIHPFSDGNGRMGRLWQHVMLVRFHSLFEHVPVESIIHARQEEYYRVLGACDRAGNSTAFVEFALESVLGSVEEFLHDLRPEPMTAKARLEVARHAFGFEEFSRKDYLAQFKALSTATASRDLREGVEAGALSKRGDKSLARYRFGR
jgi:Fic family protein